MNERLPFDPGRMSGPRDAGSAPGDRPLAVSALASMIDSALRAGLPATVRVVGEVSGFTDRTHWYFRLKDEEATVDCVMFAAAAKKVRLRPENGQKVILTGRVEYYARQGRTQLYVTAIEPVGEGELERRLRELVERLRARGWLDPERKRPLPAFPRRVAVVTSATGAALQDVLVTMKRRCPAVAVAVVDVRVQGESAAPEIASAIDWLSAEHERLGIDAVLLTRGGGSIEDLWAFNELIVAEAVHACAVPVVAAIGHETDVTVAELVADERCATPTQAAVRLTPDRAALLEEVDRLGVLVRTQLARRMERERTGTEHLGRRLAHSAAGRLSGEALRLERLSGRLARQRPDAVFASRRSTVRELDSRLHRGIADRVRGESADALAEALDESWASALDRRRQRLRALERELVVAGPESVLARGYSVTTLGDGRVVRSVGEVGMGEPVLTRVADGSFESIVGRSREEARIARSEPPPPRIEATPARSVRLGRGKRGAAAGRDQMDLF